MSIVLDYNRTVFAFLKSYSDIFPTHTQKKEKIFNTEQFTK